MPVTSRIKVNEKDKDIVSSKSNLNFQVIEDLLFLLGFTVDEFKLKSDDNTRISTKQIFIDRNIIKTRNEVAHGENKQIQLSHYSEVETFIVDFIDTLKEKIVDICENKQYLIKCCV